MKKAIIAAAAMVMAVASANVSFAAEASQESFVKETFEQGTFVKTIDNVAEEWKNIRVIDVDINELARKSDKIYEWTLRPGDIYRIGPIHREEGSGLLVSCALLNDVGKDIMAGIMDANLKARAVQGLNAVSHDFKIYDEGKYYGFTANVNEEDIEVAFIYKLT